MIHALQNCVAEWAYSSGKAYGDPFNEVELSVVFSDPQGGQQTVPAFWAGDQSWRVRYSPLQVGRYHYRTVCSDTGNATLHDQEGELEVAPYAGDNPLLRHGPLRIAADRRHFEHRDGTPFLWLGDTWWMGLCRRLNWPDEFQQLTADRVAKGFTVIQIVAGLYPDMQPFDDRGRNEAGFPWEEGFTRINPAYFDMADLRIAHLVRAGLVPCIVGSWGYFLDYAGLEVLKKHWRYLVARYSAYPVTWCAAGEALMSYYLNRDFHQEAHDWVGKSQAAWADLIRTIRAHDPIGHPITIHPTRYGRQQVDDPAVLDYEMLQTGHGGYRSLADTVLMMEESLAAEPAMPVLVSEVNYEGILETNREEIQRFLFWSCLLSGAAGHTYGANGLWQVNRREQPYGASPHGMSWGNVPWEDASRLPGSRQLGIAKKLMDEYLWQQFQPHPEWATPHQDAENRMALYAAGIPGQVRILFIPNEQLGAVRSGMAKVIALEPGVHYHALYVNPKDGARHELGVVEPDAEGEWTLPIPPIFQDWVLILTAGSH
jgi:hypothetical protein